MSGLLMLALSVELQLPPGYDEHVKAAMDALFVEDYQKAEPQIDWCIKENPDEPVGYLLKAGMWDVYMLDFATNSKKGEFFSLLDKTIELSEAGLKSSATPESKSRYHLYKGSALAYKAVYVGRGKNYIQALNWGFQALRELEKCLEYDPTNYDAQLAIGAYSVAVSFLQKYVPWQNASLKKSEGIRMMVNAADRSKFSRALGYVGLAYVYTYDKQYQKAIDRVNGLLTLYPASRTARWTLGFALTEAGRWEEAVENYSDLLSRIQKYAPGCHVCLAEVEWQLSKSYMEMGRKNSAWDHLKRGEAELALEDDPSRKTKVKEIGGKLAGQKKALEKKKW